ncbi:MAG: AsmA-like C-terminal region-containing protein [Hyphomicrobium aestuarii]|nr:AsmA-like C-terminal region-containing protein [Hyphomicrobium aestuarii]
MKALHVVAGRRTAGLRRRIFTRPVRSAVLLACVGLVLFAPLLLDDSIFRPAHVLRPSEDTILINQTAVILERPNVKLTSGTVSLPPSMTGRARTGEALAALVKGGSARMALRSPVFVIDMSGGDSKAADPDLAGLLDAIGRFGSDPSPLVAALLGGDFETLVVRDGVIVFGLGGGRSFTLTGFEAEIGIKRRTVATLKGSTLFHGELVRFDLVVGARVERRWSSRVPIKGKVESSLFQAVIDGQLDLARGVALSAANVELSVPNVRALARSFGHMWPSGAGFRDFVARGTLDWSGPTLDMTRGRYRLDGNEATGSLSLTLDPERAKIAGTLAFGAFDLRPYFTAAPIVSATAAAAGLATNGTVTTAAAVAQALDASQTAGPVAREISQAVKPPAPSQPPPMPRTILAALAAAPDVRWPMLGHVDADLRLSAEQVQIGSFEAGQSAASLTIQAGQLVFNVAEMLLDGGARAVFEFGSSGSASYPNYVLRGRLEDADLSLVSQVLAGVALARAKGKVVFNLTSSGTSGIDLLSRMAGKVDVAMPEGGVIACNHRSLALAAKPTRPVGDRTAGDVCGAGLTVAPVTLGAKLNSGLVIADKVDVTAGDEFVSLKGTFDLVTNGIDMALTAGPILPSRPDGSRPDPLRTDRSVVTMKGRPDALAITAVP